MAVDGPAAAVHEDGPQADRGHEDDILQRRLERVRLLHRAAAQLDHNQAIAELADVTKRFDKRLGLAYGMVHAGTPQPSGEVAWMRSKRLSVGMWRKASIRGK